MLSDYERRELALIEHGLLAEDRRLARALGAGRAARGRRWPARGLVGLGILMLVVGLLAGGDGALILQGLVTSGAGMLWSWRARLAAVEAAAGTVHSRSDG